MLLFMESNIKCLPLKTRFVIVVNVCMRVIYEILLESSVQLSTGEAGKT